MVHTRYAVGGSLACGSTLDPSLTAIGGVVYLFVVQHITGELIKRGHHVGIVHSYGLVAKGILNRTGAVSKNAVQSLVGRTGKGTVIAKTNLVVLHCIQVRACQNNIGRIAYTERLRVQVRVTKVTGVVHGSLTIEGLTGRTIGESAVLRTARIHRIGPVLQRSHKLISLAGQAGVEGLVGVGVDNVVRNGVSYYSIFIKTAVGNSEGSGLLRNNCLAGEVYGASTVIGNHIRDLNVITATSNKVALGVLYCTVQTVAVIGNRQRCGGGVTAIAEGQVAVCHTSGSQLHVMIRQSGDQAADQAVHSLYGVHSAGQDRIGLADVAAYTAGGFIHIVDQGTQYAVTAVAGSTGKGILLQQIVEGMIVGRSSGNHITGCAVAAAEYHVHQISQYIVNGADNAFALDGRCGNHGQQTGYKPGCAILAVRICHTNIQHTLDHIGVDQLFGIQSAFLCRITILQHACNRQQLVGNHIDVLPQGVGQLHQAIAVGVANAQKIGNTLAMLAVLKGVGAGIVNNNGIQQIKQRNAVIQSSGLRIPQVAVLVVHDNIGAHYIAHSITSHQQQIVNGYIVLTVCALLHQRRVVVIRQHIAQIQLQRQSSYALCIVASVQVLIVDALLEVGDIPQCRNCKRNHRALQIGLGQSSALAVLMIESAENVRICFITDELQHLQHIANQGLRYIAGILRIYLRQPAGIITRQEVLYCGNQEIIQRCQHGAVAAVIICHKCLNVLHTGLSKAAVQGAGCLLKVVNRHGAETQFVEQGGGVNISPGVGRRLHQVTAVVLLQIRLDVSQIGSRILVLIAKGLAGLQVLCSLLALISGPSLHIGSAVVVGYIAVVPSRVVGRGTGVPHIVIVVVTAHTGIQLAQRILQGGVPRHLKGLEAKVKQRICGLQLQLLILITEQIYITDGLAVLVMILLRNIMQVGRVNIRCGTLLQILCVSVLRIGTVGVCNLCGNVAEQPGGELIKQDGIQLAGLQTGIVPDLSLLLCSKPTGILQNQLLNNIIYHIALIAAGHTNQVTNGLVNIQEAAYDTKVKIAAQQFLYDIAVGTFRTPVGRNVPNQLHNTAYNIGRGSCAAGHSVNCAQIYIAGIAGQQKQYGLAVQE